MHKIDAAGHVNNEFVEEDAATNRPPTYFSADWFNAVQAEIANVITSTGDVLDKGDNTQLNQAIENKILALVSSRVGEIAIITANAAPTNAMKTNGALINRASYPLLWEYAEASGNIEVDDATWLANKAANGTNGKFSPGNGATTMRIPDLRGDFIRIASDGSSVDSARVVGSFQQDLIKEHDHSSGFSAQVQAAAGGLNFWAGALSSNTGKAGGNETRPRNTAYIAVIYYK